MTYRNRWIGFEEGHQEFRIQYIGKHEADGYEEPIWITDFFIRIDGQALRLQHQKHGINIFWADFAHRKRWRALRSSIMDAIRMLRKRIKQGKER